MNANCFSFSLYIFKLDENVVIAKLSLLSIVDKIKFFVLVYKKYIKWPMNEYSVTGINILCCLVMLECNGSATK